MNQTELNVEFQHELFPGSVKKFAGATGTKSRDLWQVEPGQIRLLDGFNVRERNEAFDAHVRSLADSMKAEGFKQHKPLAGYVAKEDSLDVLYVYDGHCRYEAALLAINEGAEIKHIPVVVSQAGANIEDLTVELVRSNEGKPLTPIEKAVVCKRLLGYGWPITDVAKRLGFTAQYVADLLLLLAAPQRIRKMVANNEVSASVAISAVKRDGPAAADKLEAAKVRAQAAGKTKVTAKHIKAPQDFDAIAKSLGPAMGKAILQLVDESGFDLLSEELRDRFNLIAAKLSPRASAI